VTGVAILDRDGTIIDVLRDEETGAVTVAFHPDHIRLLSGAVVTTFVRGERVWDKERLTRAYGGRLL